MEEKKNRETIGVLVPLLNKTPGRKSTTDCWRQQPHFLSLLNIFSLSGVNLCFWSCSYFVLEVESQYVDSISMEPWKISLC